MTANPVLCVCANFRDRYSKMFSEGLESSKQCCHWHCLLGINEKMKQRGSVHSQIDPYGTLAAAGLESWYTEANCFAKASMGDHSFPHSFN